MSRSSRLVALAQAIGADVKSLTNQIAALSTRTVTVVSGTTYTVLESDKNKHIRFTSASAVAVTIPATLTTSWECSWEQYGAGVPTFSGVTMRSRGGANKSAGQYAVGGIRQINSSETILFGDITT